MQTGESVAHTTSIAVWDVPSPLTIHRPSSVKVGVKCSQGCCLAGAGVALLDETGRIAARGKLGPSPCAGTDALYWTELEMPEVASEGARSWSAAFAETETQASHVHAHRASSFIFHFLTVRPPEHTVTVRVLEKGAQNAIENVELRLGVYKACTDRTGVATLAVPGGTYELRLWKSGAEAASRSVEVNANLTVEVEVSTAPAEQEPYWM